jgi:hypothetical protein
MEDLPRRLGVVDGTAIVIGGGIFLLPNVIARNAPSEAGMDTDGMLPIPDGPDLRIALQADAVRKTTGEELAWQRR